MPWQEASTVSLREEFVTLASREETNVRELCRRFGISPTTGYRWLARHRACGVTGLGDRSRRQRYSPHRTAAEIEAAILALRAAHPVWGARKRHQRLVDLGHADLPSASTITTILRRHGRLDPAAAAKHAPWQRFEHPAPNDLWRMDYKGHVALADGRTRCHPLTVLDDHSRFAVAVAACADERGATVRVQLTAAFRRYGLPTRMLADNGPPFGSVAGGGWTPLTVWMLRLGVAVSHGRPAHPQTQGKEERFHRTLLAEAITGRAFADLAAAQVAFDRFRDVSNLERPHQALGLATPASRYRPSPRTFPDALPPIEYGPDDLVRKVQGKGQIFVGGRTFHVGQAFHGYPVALRPTRDEAVKEVFFCHRRLGLLDLSEPLA